MNDHRRGSGGWRRLVWKATWWRHRPSLQASQGGLAVLDGHDRMNISIVPSDSPCLSLGTDAPCSADQLISTRHLTSETLPTGWLLSMALALHGSHFVRTWTDTLSLPETTVVPPQGTWRSFDV